MSTVSALRAAWHQHEYATAEGLHTPAEINKILKLGQGDLLYDLGCGDGHMVEYFNDRGVIAFGVDMVQVHPDTKLLNLCEMSQVYMMTPRQYGLCLGVMDHVPESKVPQTLTNLAHMVRGELYFTIPIRDFGYNDLIGKRIQQTIKPIGWWRNRLTEIGLVKIGQIGEWMTAHVQCR